MNCLAYADRKLGFTLADGIPPGAACQPCCCNRVWVKMAAHLLDNHRKGFWLSVLLHGYGTRTVDSLQQGSGTYKEQLAADLGPLD
jgi:hypothetical protein